MREGLAVSERENQAGVALLFPRGLPRADVLKDAVGALRLLGMKRTGGEENESV